MICPWLTKRKPNSHKGDYGHVLIIAGSRGMSGASVLSAMGALRGGAGLVTVAVPENQQPIVAEKIRPEAMTLPLPETSEGTFAVDAISLLLNFVVKRKVTSIGLGPGLSRSFETRQFVQQLMIALSKADRKMAGIVLDADGFLSLKPEGGMDVFQDTDLPIIVTPHPGELAQFCGLKTFQIQENRIEFARKFAKLNRVVCVLKGYQTVITDGEKTFLNTTGNPGMATGGSGDVLTGLIAALIPQMKKGKERVAESRNSQLTTHNFSNLLRAACVGVFIHGLAGDLAKKEKTEISMIAGDIAEKIPEAFARAIR